MSIETEVPPAPFIGVDGARLSSTRRGWVVVALSDDRFLEARFFDQFGEVLAAFPAPSTIAVDIPIGLTQSTPRAADTAARKVLGSRSATVFSAPVRQVLGADCYEDAKAIAQHACGKMISRQSWAIVPLIREVDRYRSDPRVYEVHPEVSFRTLACAPLAFSKKSWGGLAERRRLLRQAGIVIPDVLGDASCIPADDILDAAVAAWSGRRIARGEAISLPEIRTERDGTREIAIWA